MFDLPGKDCSFPGKLEEVERRISDFATIYITFDFQLVMEEAGLPPACDCPMHHRHEAHLTNDAEEIGIGVACRCLSS